MSNFLASISRDMDAVAPGILSDFTLITRLDAEQIRGILAVLLRWGCDVTHSMPMYLANYFLDHIPKDLLFQHLQAVIDANLDLDDSLIYENLRMTLRLIAPSLLSGYAERGLLSPDCDVRESAQNILDEGANYSCEWTRQQVYELGERCVLGVKLPSKSVGRGESPGS